MGLRRNAGRGGARRSSRPPSIGYWRASRLRGTVAANVLTWGTGAINVDACRAGYRSQMAQRWRAMVMANVVMHRDGTYGKESRIARTLHGEHYR